MNGEPAPDLDVWRSGLRWVEAAHMQVGRFEEAFYQEAAALADARLRHRLNDDSEVNRLWRESSDRHHEHYDPQRPLRVPTWALHMQVASELDLLIVAVRNVMRAQDRIPKEHRPGMSGQDVLELLRNVSEHWNEVGGRSASALVEDHPDIEVGGLAFTSKEVWVGGEHGVPLSRIQAWLRRVWDALVASLDDAGFALIDDLRASRIEGDDDLPWPPERLRFHWSIPRVDEQDWPREQMSPEVADLLAEKFARLRSRDPEN